MVAGPRSLASAWVAVTLLGMLASGCEGAQQGYYGPCDEPAGLALGCTPDPLGADEFSAFDACRKLAACGVILARDEPQADAPADRPEAFDRCVAEIAAATESAGAVVLACIETATCPDLAATDPGSVQDEDPRPDQDRIEGVIGFCGRLDP